MKETMVGKKLGMLVSTKIAVGVILVCVGAGLGAVAFNGLVPTFLTPSNNSISMAGVAASGWTQAKEYDTLVKAVSYGADIKVVQVTEGVFFQEWPCLFVAANASNVGCFTHIDSGDRKRSIYVDKTFTTTITSFTSLSDKETDKQTKITAKWYYKY